MSMVTMVAAATNIAKSARRRVCAGHGARAMVTLPEVAALLEVTALSKEVLAVPKVLALLEEITAVLEVRTAPSALVLRQTKARDARRPTCDANPRNFAGNIFSPS